MDSDRPPEWLLLIYVLPPKPDYHRVKIWRRLQALGAVAVKNSVYVLPSNERTREDFQWLQKEIEGIGGEASVCEARFIDGMADSQIRLLFNTARDSDYAQLSEEIRSALGSITIENGKQDDARQRARRLRKNLDQIVALDFFGAHGREAAEALLSQLDELLRDQRSGASAISPSIKPVGKTWVTRRDVGVDRMASAWLIQRFIDPAAKFIFLAKGDSAQAGQLRFDMADAEYTHDGDRCTFEVLLDRFSLAGKGLATIGRIIHDLDLKDGKFREEETAGVEAVFTGIQAIYPQDDQRIRSAASMLDSLLRTFDGRAVDK
jgi:hypothetical protein